MVMNYVNKTKNKKATVFLSFRYLSVNLTLDKKVITIQAIDITC